MINVTGSIKRAFLFPADSSTALAYYGDLSRIATFLPHITLVKSYSHNQVRLHYKTVELGTYTISIFCDLQSIADKDESILYVKPLKTSAPAPAQATLNTTSGHGYFTSQTNFYTLGEQTRVEYSLQLQANLLRPLGLRLMPGRVVNRIVQSITDGRTHEIADGFIERSITAFPLWLANDHQATDPNANSGS
jgi:hypothetical protein